jgi:uncharacterized membrane protein
MDRRPLIAAGTLLGMGMGGFVDGILFHQVLQVHGMLSGKRPIRGLPAEQLVVNLEVNMFWDGLFHVMTWMMTAIGLALLWSAVRSPGAVLSTRTFIGTLWCGWGLFNVVEGIIDHHVLHIHHVTETAGHLMWDLMFIGAGTLMLAVGGTMVWNDRGHRVTTTPK